MANATVASTSTAGARTRVDANEHQRRRRVVKSNDESIAHDEYLARMNAFLEATDDDQPAPAVSLEQIVKAVKRTHSEREESF